MLHVLSNVVEVRIKAGVFISSYDMALGRFKRELASPGGKVTPSHMNQHTSFNVLKQMF